MMEASHSEDDILERLRLACETASNSRDREPLRAASQTFLDAAMQDGTIALRAAQALDSLPLRAAAWLAILLGALVEDGLEPEQSWPYVLARFRSVAASLPESTDADDSHDEDSTAYVDALTKLSQSMVAHLSKLPAARLELAADDSFRAYLDQIDSHGPGATWTRDAISRTSGRIVVLHAESARGFRAEYHNIGNCFHLFTLLQQAIGNRLPGGRAPQASVSTKDSGDSACWHFGHGLSPKADLMASIWGEGSPQDIPFINGEQIVVLWPPLLQQRSWDAGFFGCELDGMPATVSLGEPLSTKEAADLLARLDIPQPQRQDPAHPSARKWWRPWAR